MPWVAEEIEDLIALRSGEAETLEFKAELPSFSDRGKAEFLKDICAMANASGGSILYGIAEDDGYADRLSLSVIEEHDGTIRRLAQIIESGIEPPINVKASIVSVAENEVLAIEVPVSMSGPHRFKFNDKYRFVVRRERHISDLSYDQLRAAFGNQAKRRDLARLWWAKLDPTEYFSRPIMQGPSMLCALVPVAHDGFSTLIDPLSVDQDWTQLILSRFGGGSHGFNYHGMCVFPGGLSDEVWAFSQAERTGPVFTWRALDSFYNEEPGSFFGAWFIEFIRDSFRMQKRVFSTQGIMGSFFLFSGLRDIEGWTMKTVDHHGFVEKHAGTVSNIEIGPVFIDDLDKFDDSSEALFGPIADRLWQSYSQPKCPRQLISEPLR